MASNLIPTKGTTPLPLTTEKTPHVKNPTHGEIRNFAADHSSRPMGHELDQSLRPSHEVDHHSTHSGGPLALGAPSHGALGAPSHGASGPLGHGRDQLIRGSRDRHSYGDDSALVKQILSTHAPDIDLDVRPVLAIVEDIMRLAYPSSSDAIQASNTTHAATIGVPSTHLDTSDHDKALAKHTPYHHEADLHAFLATDHDEIIKMLACPINKISCEIIDKCSLGGESHNIAIALLQALTSYSWDAKVIITFAAFAFNYCEFWQVEHLPCKNPLAKNIAILRDLPDTMVEAAQLKKKFEAVLELVNAVFKVTHCIIEFKELPHVYITSEAPEMKAATALIPMAVYWIIRSLLLCASALLNLIIGSGDESITLTPESWEYMSLAHKLGVIMEHLQGKLKICKDVIERKKAEDAYLPFNSK